MKYPMNKHKTITLDRIKNYTSPGVFQDVNLLSKQVERENRNSITLSVYSVPNLERIPFSSLPPESSFRSCSVGESFGPSWATHWFILKIKVPSDWIGKEVHLIWDSNSESLLYDTQGNPIQGFTDIRNEYILLKQSTGGENFTFYVEMACNSMFGNGDYYEILPPNPNKYYLLESCYLSVPDSLAVDLNYTFQIISDMSRELNQDSSRAARAMYIANQMMNTINLQDRSTWIKGLDLGKQFLSEKNGDSGHELVAIGHCHIDCAWLWPYDETKRKCARSWSSQLRLLERYPEYIFSCSQAQQFEWIEQNYPSIFKQVKTQVAANRFTLVGGTWIEMDCNLTNGESLVRQFLYGQRYFQEKFGKKCKIFWLPDTFGYSSQIPQIMQLSGIEYFLTQKLSWNLMNQFPHTTFWWEGLDGSKVLTHFPPASTLDSQITVKENLTAIKNHKDKDRTKESILLFGKGDGGGGPTPAMLERLSRLKDVNGLPKLRTTTPDSFFESLKNTSEGLLTWKGELYLELHRGTFTSQGKNKLYNRQTEWLLRRVELFSVIAKARTPTFSYPKVELDRIWKLTLLNQFHDVIPGTSIEIVTIESLEIYQDIMSSATNLANLALQSIIASYGINESKEKSKSKKNQKKKEPLSDEDDWELIETENEIALFNTLPFSRTQVVPLSSSIVTGMFTKSKTQYLGNETLVVVKNIPEMSLSIVQPDNSFTPVQVSEVNNNFILENQYLRVTVTKSGHITSIIDKRAGNREIVSPGTKANNFLMYEDIPLYWDAWDCQEYHLEGGREVTGGTARISESGPIRASILVETSISGTSNMTQRISLDAVSPKIEFHCDVNWNENRQFLKVEFPVDIHCDYATFETQYGLLRRPTHFNTSWDYAKFEVCAQRFADISEYGYGVSLLNDCKYGYAIHSNVIRLSLLRAPKAPDQNCDIGNHQFKFALLPHLGSCEEANIVQEGMVFNEPLVVSSGKFFSKQTLDKYFWTTALSGRNSLIIDNVKQAEDNPSQIVIRLYETSGARGKSTLSTIMNVRSAFISNVLEEKIADINWTSGGCEISYKPFQIITVVLQL